ncbi:MAG: PKD domain-containing protein [bacterium]
MIKMIKQLFCLLLPLTVTVLFFSCTEDDNTLAPLDQALVVEFISGPAEGGSVLNNARFTFEWRARGGGSNATFQVQLSGVDASGISTGETSRTYPGQPEGNHTFTVTAISGSETATATRNFSVGANLGPPDMTIFGARGSASTGGSGATPAYAPGQTAFFRWTGQDVDRFGEITGYRWKIADSEPFSEFSLGEVAGFEVPAAAGTYTFTLEAMDNAGATSTTTISYEVKAATILILDDKSQGSAVDEIDEDIFFGALFEGFASARWDVSEQGEPATADLTPFQVVVVYSEGGSGLWRGIGTDYPESSVALSEYMDGGGRLWAMGQGIMEDIDRGHANPPDPTEFEIVYLHMAGATGDTLIDPGRRWSRAGDFSGDLKFSFADDVLGDPLNFPRITMNVQSGDVDEIVAADDAEIIYTGLGGLGDNVGDVALRWPAGGTDTKVVFMTFPLFEDAAVKASLLNSRALTQQIMREMNQ